MLGQFIKKLLPFFLLFFITFGLFFFLFDTLTLTVQAQTLSRPLHAAKPETAVSSAAPLVTQTTDVIAVVNGAVINTETWQTAVAIDRTISQLLGQPPQSDAAMLETLVNGELVRQAAADAEFTVAGTDVDRLVQQLLARGNSTQEALTTQLAAQGVAWPTFVAHLADLWLVEQFVQQQSQAAQRSPDAWVAALQAGAQISFGDAVRAEAVPAATTTSLESRPAPTAVPPTAVPTTAIPATATAVAPDPPSAAPGASVPLPALNTVDAVDALTLADFQGRPTLVSFWTTWCPYCRAQTPLLVGEYGRFADQGIQFVGVNVREAQDVVQPYVTDAQIPYPILLDGSGELASVFQVAGYPTTILLDADGQMIGRHVGQLSIADLDNLLSPLLADS